MYVYPIHYTHARAYKAWESVSSKLCLFFLLLLLSNRIESNFDENIHTHRHMYGQLSYGFRSHLCTSRLHHIYILTHCHHPHGNKKQGNGFLLVIHLRETRKKKKKKKESLALAISKESKSNSISLKFAIRSAVELYMLYIYTYTIVLKPKRKSMDSNEFKNWVDINEYMGKKKNTQVHPTYVQYSHVHVRDTNWRPHSASKCVFIMYYVKCNLFISG